MALPPDYHMHTPLCRHATGTPREYAAQAVRLGFNEIGFSDHSPMPRDDFDDWRMRASDLDRYVQDVEAARREFPQLTIKLALEVDFIPGYEGWIKELAARYPWDYFIGSVHYVESWAIDSPHETEKWKQRDIAQVWSSYFERLAEAASSGFFDIIGHVDLCKKFGYYPKSDCSVLYRSFLERARAGGVAIELNTAGLRKDCKEIYPSRALLEVAAELGVPITFGSDAHAPEEVGLNFAEAIELARSVGYTEYSTFTQRNRQARKL